MVDGWRRTSRWTESSMRGCGELPTYRYLMAQDEAISKGRHTEWSHARGVRPRPRGAEYTIDLEWLDLNPEPNPIASRWEPAPVPGAWDRPPVPGPWKSSSWPAAYSAYLRATRLANSRPVSAGPVFFGRGRVLVGRLNFWAGRLESPYISSGFEREWPDKRAQKWAATVPDKRPGAWAIEHVEAPARAATAKRKRLKADGGGAVRLLLGERRGGHLVNGKWQPGKKLVKGMGADLDLLTLYAAFEHV